MCCQELPPSRKRGKAKPNQNECGGTHLYSRDPGRRGRRIKKIQGRSQLYRKLEASLGLGKPVSKQNKRHC